MFSGDFDPNGVGLKDAGVFGLPHKEKDAEIVLIPMPWDVTTSYRSGAAEGPDLILDASPQLDLFHPDFPKLWEAGVFMLQEQGWIHEASKLSRQWAEEIIEAMEQGEELNDDDLELLAKVNDESHRITSWLKKESLRLLGAGKLVGVVGGDHSVPLGLMQALADHHGEYGILHFDAHHDYRKAYIGFSESHASIMYNAAKVRKINKFVQVGIRDYCEAEAEFAKADPTRFVTFYDADLKAAAFKGKSWHEQCEAIVKTLPKNIYISFDIDGLAPHLCPSTGTPVPGGLEFEQAVYLIKMASEHCKIIGFDVVEVAGEPNAIDANVGARILWHLCGYAHNSQQR